MTLETLVNFQLIERYDSALLYYFSADPKQEGERLARRRQDARRFAREQAHSLRPYFSESVDSADLVRVSQAIEIESFF
jgi:hypothetical protein